MEATVGDAGLPQLGFGTWQLSGRHCYEAVLAALDTGYRHLDTAQMYGNEATVGQALADSGVARDEVWLTTKLDRGNLAARDVGPSLRQSLDRLGVGTVDLLLIHWPSRQVPLAETLEAMRAEQEAGRTRHLGVSNFPSDLLADAAAIAPLATDQVEYHALLDQTAVLTACRDRGMALTAYSPLAKGRALREPVVRDIAAAHGASPAQVALAWLLRQDGVAVIPRSSDPDHVRSNWEARQLRLTEQDVQQLDALPKQHRVIDPPFAPRWD